MDIQTIESNFDKGDKITKAQAVKLMEVYTSAISALESLHCPAYRLVLQDIQNKKEALARRTPVGKVSAAIVVQGLQGALTAYPEGKLVPKDLLTKATEIVLDKDGKSQAHLVLRATIKEAWKRWHKVEPDNKTIAATIKRLDEITEKTPVQGRIDSMTTTELRDVLTKFLARRSAKLKSLQTDKLHK